jgi:hypothetical protein
MRGPEFGDNLDNLNPFDEGVEKEPTKRQYIFTNNDLPDHPTIFKCYVDIGTKSEMEMMAEAEAEYRNTVGVERNSDYIGISVVLE